MFHLPYVTLASSSTDNPFGLSLDQIIEKCATLNSTSISGKHDLLARGASWITTDGCTCGYRYGGKLHPPNPMPEWLDIVSVHLAKLIGLEKYPFSGVNVNYYSDGRQSLFWHADGESLFANPANEVTIVSLSLGATREFQFKMKFASQPEDVYKVDLASGDVLVMAGAMQSHYLHQIPKHNTLSERYNLTFRYISSHYPTCQGTPCSAPFTGRFHPGAKED